MSSRPCDPDFGWVIPVTSLVAGLGLNAHHDPDDAGQHLALDYRGSFGRHLMTTSETYTIPARSGAVVRVPEGAALRIIDVEGQQVADLFAVCADDFSDYLSARNSRAAGWALFPSVGSYFLAGSYRPMFQFEADDSPGPHDLLAPPCSHEMYALLGYEGYHSSCSENFRIAAESIDWHPDLVPDPVDWFQNTPVDSDGTITARTALSRPGDSVTLRALTDVFAIVSACSMDLPDKMINGDRCTSIGVEVLP